MVETYFKNIESVILNEIMLARKSIKIAVAWFNLKSILDILTLKLRGGISVEIILQYDEINYGGKYSLNFCEYEKYGGVLIWAQNANSTMHQKFCVIDNETVITGSFNWTNRAAKMNDEDIQVHHEDFNLATSYLKRFEELKTKYTYIKCYKHKKVYTKLHQNNLQERIRTFVSQLSVCDLSQYTAEYIKTFRDYWLTKVKFNKLRFEEKSDFLMRVELDTWGILHNQLKEEEEYNNFLAEIEENARLEYQRYINSLPIDDNKSLEELTDKDLAYLKEEFEKMQNNISPLI